MSLYDVDYVGLRKEGHDSVRIREITTSDGVGCGGVVSLAVMRMMIGGDACGCVWVCGRGRTSGYV